MLSLLLLFVYFYPADGNHYLIETSDNSEEAGSGMDYAEPGCIELRTRFSVSCVREGCMKFLFLLFLLTFFCQGGSTNPIALRRTSKA